MFHRVANALTPGLANARDLASGRIGFAEWSSRTLGDTFTLAVAGLAVSVAGRVLA